MKSVRHTVLLVEDNEQVRSLLAEVFDGSGYTPLTASNGVEAVELLERRSVDVVLTDLRMPKMDGLELGMHMKSDPRLREIPIVLLSATPMKDSWAALDTFAVLLVKPCPLQDVVDGVARALQKNTERADQA
ncbi:response regulator [Herbaspirillum seropedicae]|uniref:response regulator n=1 Tax=Herbaspirillum seropedicae TaxID=964 RepID=UPI00285547F8|nr:response regulator [Herbaspirillum seropedicae]MDR6394615.1 CheY-like chemotaxis protein [Herbaspirillum seropedicae]